MLPIATSTFDTFVQGTLGPSFLSMLYMFQVLLPYLGLFTIMVLFVRLIMKLYKVRFK